MRLLEYRATWLLLQLLLILEHRIILVDILHLLTIPRYTSSKRLKSLSTRPHIMIQLLLALLLLLILLLQLLLLSLLLCISLLHVHQRIRQKFIKFCINLLSFLLRRWLVVVLHVSWFIVGLMLTLLNARRLFLYFLMFLLIVFAQAK